jgi:serine/threonine-protein kinase
MKPRRPRSYDKPAGTMVLGLDVVLALNPEGAGERSMLRPPEVALLDLVDGRRSIEEILQLSQTSWFVAMRRLRSLCERGVVTPVKTANDAGASRPPPKTADSKMTITDNPTVAAKGPDDARSRTVDLTDVVSRMVPGGAPPVAPGRGSAATTQPFAQSPVTSPSGSPSPSTSPAPRRDPGGSAGAGEDRQATPGATALAQTAVRLDASHDTVHVDRRETDRDLAVVPAAQLSVQVGPPAPAAADPMLGTLAAPGGGKRAKSFKLGRYEVLARIGQGGMGSVYLCRQPGHWGFQRLFTLKVIREHAAENKEAMRSFLREARIGGLLSHPNILGVVDVGNYKGQPFLVLDYIEGTSLAELISNAGSGPPSAALVVPVLLDALRGLQAAHEQVDAKGRSLGIVHCDLSPHNIIVGLDGAARITDFGAARLAGEAAEPGEEDLPAVGKPGYMSPEQLCGNPLDGRTDVFAAGVVMWTSLTGKKLFVDPSYEQTIINVLRKKVDPPSAHGAPAALDDICLKALSRAPESRYQSAEEMRLALHRAASKEALLASTAEIGRWVKRTAGEAIDERRRLLTASTEPDQAGEVSGGGHAGSSTLVGSPAPSPPGGQLPVRPSRVMTDPERFRPTITIDSRERPPRRRPTPEITGRLDTADARQLSESLRRRPWLVILAAAVATAIAVLGAQAVVRSGHSGATRRRAAGPGSDAAMRLRAAEPRPTPPPAGPPAGAPPRAAGLPVDIEVPPAPASPANRP